MFLYGHSLGAALAIDVAATMSNTDDDEPSRELAGLILESPFLSAIRTRMDYTDEESFGESLSSSSIPSLSRNFLEPLDRYKNEEKIQVIRTDMPIFIGHGTNDAVVPYEHGQKLFDLFTGDQKAAIFLETDSHTLHNETDASSIPFYAALKNFVKNTLDEDDGDARVNAVGDGYGGREPFSWMQQKRSFEGRERGRGNQRSQWDDFLVGLREEDSASPRRQPPQSRTRTALRETGDDDVFGFISVRRAPQIDYDAQEKTQTVNIIVELTGEMSTRGHQILTLQSSETKVSPHDDVSRRVAPAIYDKADQMDLVNHFKGCTFKTQIGKSVSLLGTFQLNERNARATVTLPAKICKTEGPRSGFFQSPDPLLSNYRECQEFSYQFLDQTTCKVSNPLRAMDAL